MRSRTHTTQTTTMTGANEPKPRGLGSTLYLLSSYLSAHFQHSCCSCRRPSSLLLHHLRPRHRPKCYFHRHFTRLRRHGGSRHLPRPPYSLLRHNIDPDPDFYMDLDLVVDAPNAALSLDLFLPLLRGHLYLDPELVLASQEDPPIYLPSQLLPLLLLPSLSPSLCLQQPRLPPPIRPMDIYLPPFSDDSIRIWRAAHIPSSSSDCQISNVTDRYPY